MLTYPEISPIIFSIGNLHVRWYGFMYFCALVSAWILGKSRAQKKTCFITPDEFDTLLLYTFLGIMLGGRLGYIVFYEPMYFLNNPTDIFSIWQGGMSFHGGFLGVLAVHFIKSRQMGTAFFDHIDFAAPLVPSGILFGRIGNFINGELWGRPTDVPWAMVFPTGGSAPRHPSQLYEAATEGILLFIIVWWFSAKPRPRMAVSGVFAIGYGCARTFCEFFREPDAHIGFLYNTSFLTMGMVLSIPLVFAGILLLILAYRNPQYATPAHERAAKCKKSAKTT